jgi:hypothetical protein
VSFLDDLYDDRINVKIASVWDGGWSAGIGDDGNGFQLKTTGLANWHEVELWIRGAVPQLYPKSAFALKRPPVAPETAASRSARQNRAAAIRSRRPRNGRGGSHPAT